MYAELCRCVAFHQAWALLSEASLLAMDDQLMLDKGRYHALTWNRIQIAKNS